MTFWGKIKIKCRSGNRKLLIDLHGPNLFCFIGVYLLHLHVRQNKFSFQFTLTRTHKIIFLSFWKCPNLAAGRIISGESFLVKKSYRKAHTHCIASHTCPQEYKTEGHLWSLIFLILDLVWVGSTLSPSATHLVMPMPLKTVSKIANPSKRQLL